MNSQPNLLELKRNTFGIVGYDDILGSHLQERTLTIEDYKNGFLYENRDRQKPYKLLVDHRTLDMLYKFSAIPTIVSFQRRKDGNFAIARMRNSTLKIREQND